MNRYAFVLILVAGIACFDVSSPAPPQMALSPILDSLFVGDSLAARKVTYYDSNGHLANPGGVAWTITPPSVATINVNTGVVYGVGKGVALVTASANGATGLALVAVSRPLDLTLLMDTVVLAPGDTLTLTPYLAVIQKVLHTVTLRYSPSPAPTVYTIDTVSGLITAGNTSAAQPYVVRVTDGTNTVVDTGAVTVLILTDTTEQGHFYETVLGTAIRHHGGGATAMNFTRLNGKLGFRLVDSVISTDSALADQTNVVSRDSLLGPQTFPIDSISPLEAYASRGIDPVCTPPRPWALWHSVRLQTPFSEIWGYSHATHDSTSGQLVVTHYGPAPGGAIIGGRYTFVAQRQDLYGDPLGVETVRGTFVTPLRTRVNSCQL